MSDDESSIVETAQELEAAMKDGAKKKKGGPGRSRVAANAQLNQPESVVDTKISTVLRNLSVISHQAGCRVITIIIRDEESHIYIDPKSRGIARDHPDALGRLIHLAQQDRGWGTNLAPTVAESYSSSLAFESVPIKGNVYNHDHQLLQKAFDCSMTVKSAKMPREAEEDTMRKRAFIEHAHENKEKEEEVEQARKDDDAIEAKNIRQIFANANIRAVNRPIPTQRSFVL